MRLVKPISQYLESFYAALALMTGVLAIAEPESAGEFRGDPTSYSHTHLPRQLPPPFALPTLPHRIRRDGEWCTRKRQLT